MEWVEPPQVAVDAEFERQVGGHPLVAATLVRRGITTGLAARAFLDPSAYTPAAPFDFPSMDAAVTRLLQAIERTETICVWGDFDADGQTSTAVLVSGLRGLGGRVVYHVPLRDKEGHGVDQTVLARILAGERPAALGWQADYAPVSLLVTCDTGVSAHAALEYAKSLGVDVIISDHHELPDALPPALAVLNPHLLPDGHPLGGLPGVGVAYQLIRALRQAAGGAADDSKLLELAALGIVADLAVQTGDCRYLLQRGIQELRTTTTPGLLALLELAEVDPANLNEEHIAFELAPRLNAAGRLGDANLAVELLCDADLGRARLLATQLEILNSQRRLQTEQVFQGALAQIERDPALAGEPAIVLAHPAWPGGVIGIVASRLVEQFHKPAVLIATAPGEPGRGSARSVEGVDITAALRLNAGLFAGYGGHAMAAGFTIDPARIPELRRALNRSLAALGSLPAPSLAIDGYVSLPELSLALVSDLERLAPFGPGNPPLTLACRDLRLEKITPVGAHGEHLQATVVDAAGNSCPVIWWQAAGAALPDGPFDLAMHLRASTYRGQRAVQVEWVDFRPTGEMSVSSPAAGPVVHDFRQAQNPLGVLKSLLREHELTVWAEAEAIARLAEHGVIAVERSVLVPAAGLVIWTAPPDPQTLRGVLAAVRPAELYLFAVNPAAERADAFLQRLAGLAKHVLAKQQGVVRLERLAGASAQPELTARKGLDWLQASGYLSWRESPAGTLNLDSGGQPDPARAADLLTDIEALLAETRAYRSYYASAADPIHSPSR